MSKGFLVLAQNSNVDYVRQAYALAMSIKATQPNINNISIITNDTLPLGFSKVFDKVIPIYFGDSAANSTWKVENRWKLYRSSPYDETIVLDADMLVLDNIENVWKFASDRDLFFTSKVIDYKNRTVVDTTYRKTFIENDLPNLYSGFCYFKKSNESLEFWKLVEFITYNWEKFYGEFSPKNYQKFYSLDVTISIAAKILGLENCFDNNQICSFTHMKSLIQGWHSVHPDWTKVAQVEIIDAETIYINQFKQSGVLHYIENSFLEDYINHAG